MTLLKRKLLLVVLFTFIGCGENEVKQNNYKNELDRLFANEEAWNTFIMNVKSGNEIFLNKAIRMWRTADAGSYSELKYAIGEALKTNPQYLFGGHLDKAEVKDICGGPDIDNNIYNSYEVVSDEVDKLIEIVKNVNGEEFQTNKEICLAALHSSYENFKIFFDKVKEAPTNKT